jgi:glutamyl-Q tRNA(Asp) synthetase
LVRIEDVDHTRCNAALGAQILQQLQRCGLTPDAPPIWQSKRSALYQRALEDLIAQSWAYPCACSRQDLATARATPTHWRSQQTVYPGTCRSSLQGKAARVWRLNTQSVCSALGVPKTLRWHDWRLGWQQQNVAAEVGDFVLRRADGGWAYQLAVVVDDAAQNISHVVRGADLADNSARQLLLQQALRLPAPVYLHTPLVLAQDGKKLSKQNGALPFDSTQPLAALAQAAQVLGLGQPQTTLADALQAWVQEWRQRYALYNHAP